MPVTTLRRRKADAYGLIAGSPFVGFSQNIATPALWYVSIYGADGEWKSDIASKTLTDGDYPSQVLAYYIAHDPLENTGDGSLLFRGGGSFNYRHRVWDVGADAVREYPTSDVNQITEALYADGYVYWIDFGFTGTSYTFKLYRTTLDLAAPTELGSVVRGSGFPASPWIDAEMRTIYGLWMDETSVYLLVTVAYDFAVGPDVLERRFITFPRAGGAGTDVLSAVTPSNSVANFAQFPLSATETYATVGVLSEMVSGGRQSALAVKDNTEDGHSQLWPADETYGWNPTVADFATFTDTMFCLSRSADNFAAYMGRWDTFDFANTFATRMVTGPASGPDTVIAIQPHPSGERRLPYMMFYRS